MKLFLLRDIKHPDRHPERPEYDSNDAMVVRARDEHHARKIAAAGADDEGEWFWNSASHSTCTELTADGLACCIITSFNAG